MAGETTITVVGNLTDDPELRFTPSGAAVAKFRIASTPRTLDRQSGEWKDGEPLFLACNIWRDAAEHVAESLQRGARVIVQGRLRQRSYETREGEKRTVYRARGRRDRPVAALRHGEGAEDEPVRRRRAAASAPPAAVVVATGSPGSGGGGGNNFDDPWATAAPASGRPLGRRQRRQLLVFDDEPPF